eukprot:13331955-Ditylum_brightwellii.AAC.1
MAPFGCQLSSYMSSNEYFAFCPKSTWICAGSILDLYSQLPAPQNRQQTYGTPLGSGISRVPDK